jgi:hypothetical protein
MFRSMVEIPADEGTDILDELGLPLGLDVALGLGFHPREIGFRPFPLECRQQAEMTLA